MFNYNLHGKQRAINDNQSVLHALDNNKLSFYFEIKFDVSTFWFLFY